MRANFPAALDAVLRHEGGFVDHPDDPGGATNKGITIGTLKRIGIDVDGDGDSDLVDLKALRRSDVDRVYRLFYWDAVRADALPSGVDYAVFDFAVNSGPSRAAEHLQQILGVTQDGDIGPKTLAALDGTDAAALVHSLCDARMKFLQQLKGWRTFGRGWTRRVDEVRAKAVALAKAPVAPPAFTVLAEAHPGQPVTNPYPPDRPSPWAALIEVFLALLKLFNRKGRKDVGKP